MSDVKAIMKEMSKQYGDSVVSKGVEFEEMTRLPTGIFPFDLATGGGFPRGRISIVYGAESSLKTTMVLLAIATEQRVNPHMKCVFIDVENSYDPDWGATLGVNNDELIYVLPDHAEQVVDISEAFLYADDVSLVAVDSIAAMITTREAEKSAEGENPGSSGLVVGKLYRKVSLALLKTRKEGRMPAFIAINQIRMKIGVMFGNPETMPGGKPLLFASSLTVRMYGKDEMDKKVHPALPAYKAVSGVVKKWKVPITQKGFEFKLASLNIPAKKLTLGQCDDWNTVSTYLKEFGLLDKGEKGKGWVMFGTPYKTLEACQEALRDDKEFADEVKATLIESVKTGEVPEFEQEEVE